MESLLQYLATSPKVSDGLRQWFLGNLASYEGAGEDWMADTIPFLFCRYEFLVDDVALSFTAQLSALQELQGKYFARSARAERESHLDSIVMRPREIRLGQERAIAWSVGKRVGERQVYEYDQRKDEISPFLVEDPSVIYSNFGCLICAA